MADPADLAAPLVPAPRDWVRLWAWCLTGLAVSGLLFAGFVYRPLPSVDTVVSGASMKVRMGLFGEARPDLEDALDRDPEHAQAHLLMGYVLQQDGNYGEALRHYEAGEELVLQAPEPAMRVDYYITCGLLRLANGDFDAVERDLAPIESSGLRPAAAFVIRSFSRLGAGDDTDFRTGLERAYLLDPSDPIFRLRGDFISEAIPWAAAYL